MMGARAVHWRLGCRFSAVWVGMGGAGAMPGRGEAALKESAPPSSAQGAGAVRGKLTGTFRVGYKINTNHRPFSLWGRPRGASIGSPNEVRPVMLSLLVIVLLSYFLGSIPGALWSSKALHGVDIRNYGSKNAGATNAFRVVGWPAGVLAMIVDLGKGFLAAGVVASYVRIDPLPELSIFGWETGVVLGLIAGFVAILGHMFPIFARFEGGKGVATAAGILFALTPITMLYTVLVFAVVLFSSRYVSLASITASIAFPTIVAIRRYALGADVDASLLVFGLVIGASIVVAHQSNIRRLLQGNENRVGSFKPAEGMLGRGEI